MEGPAAKRREDEGLLLLLLLLAAELRPSAAEEVPGARDRHQCDDQRDAVALHEAGLRRAHLRLHTLADHRPGGIGSRRGLGPRGDLRNMGRRVLAACMLRAAPRSLGFDPNL